jgi:hypothetical protein
MHIEQTTREEHQAELRSRVIQAATDEGQDAINASLALAIHQLKSRLFANGGSEYYLAAIRGGVRIGQQGIDLADLVCESLAKELPCDLVAIAKQHDEFSELDNPEEVIDAVTCSLTNMIKGMCCVR